MPAMFAPAIRGEGLDALADRRLLRELGYVEGRWTAGSGARSFEVTDPATGAKSGGIQVNRENMRAAALKGYATATDLADYLVKKGLPFRDAHEAVARAVRACEARGCDLPDLTLDELRSFSPLVAADAFAVLTVAGSLAARDHLGGTAPAQVAAAIARSRARL